MITLAFLLGQAVSSITLAQVEKLSPTAAGDAVLRDRKHGPIETFEVPTGGKGAPGVVDGQLVERPVLQGRGCVRTRWNVRFRAVPGADIGTAKVEGIDGAQEIASARGNECATTGYAHLNPGVSVEQGWEALAQLAAFIVGVGDAKLRCSDTTSSGLCRDGNTVKSGLRALSPWAITRKAEDTVLWMGVPGGIVTEVRFSAASPLRVDVERKVPAPF